MYPISLSLEGCPCLVVGGGGVALRKVQGLHQEGGKVTVVAPQVDTQIDALAKSGKITLHRRQYQSKEAASYALVIAATDDREVNRQVFADANSANVWVNVADDPELCTFHLPARVRRGPLQVAISSGGDAPFVTRRLRQLFEKRMGEEWAPWIDAAARFRKRVKLSGLTHEQQEAAFDAFFNATVDSESLTTRVPSEANETTWIGQTKAQQAQKQNTQKEVNTAPYGLVSLVGAGPGDPGLMTKRGLERLRKADAVVCDRLAVPALPCDLPATCELHFVGKEAGNHPVAQDEINATLVRLAKAGKRVVRLKGGDPYVFGRGGEEATVLANESIPFEVVPCVTAAVAVTAYAGIPVTYRKEVVRVTMVTAHEAIKTKGPQVRWDLLAKDPHAMILGYMGVTRLPKVIGYLLEGGMDPDTPAALIERGTTPAQRKVISTVSKLQEDVVATGLKPPALFAIGPTIKHADLLDWFGKRPLLGERLAMFTPETDLVEALDLQGAAIVPLPNPVTPAARMVMDAMPVTGCIVSTPAEVELMEEERYRKSWIENPRIFCLTKAALERANAMKWTHAVQIPSDAPLDGILGAVAKG